MAAVLVLTMQQPKGRGSRTATLATTTPNLLPYPGTLRWQAGARDGRVGGVGGSQHRVGDWALRERGPPKPVPGLGSHTRLVPGAVRLRATLKAFRAAPPGPGASVDQTWT